MPAEWRAPWLEPNLPVMFRSDSGALSAMRGYTIVQRVQPMVVGVNEFEYQVEAGDHVRDFTQVVAQGATP